MPAPASVKQKRAPIPLDLTHPVSRNTVAAGVFMALIGSSAERKWRSVRSRHDSREIFERSRRTSMDADHVAVIVRPGCLALVRVEVDELRDVRLDRLPEAIDVASDASAPSQRWQPLSAQKPTPLVLQE
ncbi:hypothetical protein HYPSUDRAFT_207573 [Hypholoma sublateritium FD-334 SS-4]|uniref:Uncharacterized protein n=1 Tax=Hypholoma sublateritium (strain FD-334 SS-4) TaxID=945553 RepID=A0A0D2N9J8_HYPSF|nr:hypothetical protein HYPSUDRAFT_207573 [Hypholoma sublateritium FD-334 SS-4]